MKHLIVVVVAVLGAGACTRDSGQTAEPAHTTTAPTTSTAAPESVAPRVTTAAPPDSSADAPVTSSTVPITLATVPPIIEVSETGVPGLDSDDAFCAAWSRFGGSWQVLSVGSSFLEDPDRVATWEIAAADVIGRAYGELIDNLPEQLESEAAVVADGYFGALHRRSISARVSLGDAGSNLAAVQRLSQAWLDALAKRDPFEADLAFEVPEDLRPLVDRAVAEFRSQRVQFHLDPSMVVGVETPLTDAFLETGCPDQGTLSGQEVGDG